MSGALLDGHDALLSDLDGVIYAGPHAIPGAVEALQRADREGLSLGYVTNNASRSPEAVAAHLRELGAPATAETVFGSSRVGAQLLAEHTPPGSRVLVIGSEALRSEVTALGFTLVSSADDAPDAVIQGFDPSLGWSDLAEASFAVTTGALWVATNTDRTIPVARGVAPGNGSLVAAVAAATGQQPLVAGKPEPTLFRAAAQALHSVKPLVVGDRLDTDILGGNRAGYATALVLTGVDTALSALQAVTAERPRYLLAGLDELHAPAAIVREEDNGWRCGDAWATVHEATDDAAATVEIFGPAESLDGWRAACAAWWQAVPQPETVTDPVLMWRGTPRS
ncbi:HAD-IIA family hydrolase [Psychromicrobium xiongbiense]|uniref:HAD-IIA family hydrolase n=1 Tax=Psychromicrobium xiongbiense TaxID=3051184 RepID=UPI0025528ADE|nr:HAD-IIA family hydrolase [Psychromicrobium sp. YIM S02556]